MMIFYGQINKTKIIINANILFNNCLNVVNTWDVILFDCFTDHTFVNEFSTHEVTYVWFVFCQFFMLPFK